MTPDINTAPRSTPLRISCVGLAAVPTASELEMQAVVGRHVVMQFPPACEGDKRLLSEQLRPRLPGYSVFDSGPGPQGTTCVTVLKVIEERAVLENLPLFLSAIRDFSHTAHDLCRRLAEAHRILSEDLLARREAIEKGRLGNWDYNFHGLECCFTNGGTGQVVDVRISFGGEFGVLDPFFLSRFIRTTPVHHKAARLLDDDFHDACRVLEILRACDHLRMHEAACDVLGGMVCRGLVLYEASENRR